MFSSIWLVGVERHPPSVVLISTWTLRTWIYQGVIFTQKLFLSLTLLIRLMTSLFTTCWWKDVSPSALRSDGSSALSSCNEPLRVWWRSSKQLLCCFPTVTHVRLLKVKRRSASKFSSIKTEFKNCAAL